MCVPFDLGGEERERGDDHDAQPDHDQEQEASVPRHSLELTHRSVDAREEPDQPQEPKQAKEPKAAEGRDQGEGVDPMAAQIRAPVIRRGQSGRELGDEDHGHRAVDPEQPRHALDEAGRDEGHRQHREGQLPRHLVALDERVVAVAKAHQLSHPTPS